jgi:tetratricopeptide (TPR) repeat protein
MKPPTIADSQRLLQLQEQALGSDCPQVASTLVVLAELYANEGKDEEAEAFYRRALRIQEGLSDAYRGERAETRQRLDALLQKTMPQSDTLQLKDGAPAIPRHFTGTDQITDMEIQIGLLTQTAGEDHLSVADAYTQLASLYCRTKTFDKMEPLLKEALRIREKQLGPTHLSVATALKNLSMFYASQKQDRIAEPLLKRCLLIREKNLGNTHPTAQETRALYIKLLESMR